MSTDETITYDLSCLVCGYNLRGLNPSRGCPECGLHVSRSLDANDPDAALEREAIRWNEQERKYEEQAVRTDNQQDKLDQQNARYDVILDKWEEHTRRLDQLLGALEDLVEKSRDV